MVTPHRKVLASLQHTNPQSESLRITALGPPLGVVVYIWPFVGLGQPFFLNTVSARVEEFIGSKVYSMVDVIDT